MVEQEAVNFEVASSSLARGATKFTILLKKRDIGLRAKALRDESGPRSHKIYNNRLIGWFFVY